MKILHITPMYFPAVGGGELHVTELSESLASRGHEVTVLTANVDSQENLSPGHHGGLPSIEVRNGVKVVRFSPDGGALGAALNAWHSMRGGYRSLNLIFGESGVDFLLRKPRLAQLIPYLAVSRADVIASVNWYWPPAYHAYLARKLKRFTLVGIPLFHTAEAWYNHGMYKKMLAACDAVVANTSHEAELVRERTRARVEVAGVGVRAKLFECRDGAEIRRRYGLGTLPVVGFVGRQAVNKGLAKLLEAMRTVWKWNREVRLVVAGSRPIPKGQVESTIAGLTPFEQERIVKIDDFRDDDKGSIFDSFDVFALPSIAESFGIAYLEAWLCKKPVIGARIGSTQCIIDEGVDGLLVNPTDPQDIARAIIDLLSNNDMRERMGRSGYAKTIAQYTWDKVTDKVEKLYLELVAGKAEAIERERSFFLSLT
jgi:glycosyltransferase involved in cell wall biosynthesis